MALPSKVQGSLNELMQITWADGDGNAIDLSGGTITAVIKNKATGVSRAATGSFALVTAASGIFSWDASAADVAEPGQFEVQFKAALSENEYTKSDDWEVFPDLASSVAGLEWEPNCYASIEDAKRLGGYTTSDFDTLFLQLLGQVSRGIDDFCHRTFYVETATRYYGTQDNRENLELRDDLLSATTLTADSERDWTHDGETWTDGTDFVLQPDNVFPKTHVFAHITGNYNFLPNTERYIKIVGSFGYGDGGSATPYRSVSPTATVADATARAVTVSAPGAFEAGQTILTETEQLFVSAVNGTTLYCTRGVNGTTAAAHTATAINIFVYPGRIRQAAANLAFQAFNTRDKKGMKSELIGQYQYVRDTAANNEEEMVQLVGPYRRINP